MLVADLDDRACTASIIRVVALDRVNLEDMTYTLVTASIWTTIEQSIGIICACLPMTRPLIARFLKGVKKSKCDGIREQKIAPSSIPLSRYAARHGIQYSTDTTTDGFVRLTEGNAQGNGLVTAHAFKAKGDDLPVAADAIIKQQRLEHHVESTSHV